MSKEITKEEYLAWFEARKPGMADEMRDTIEMIAPECKFLLGASGVAPVIEWNPPSE